MRITPRLLARASAPIPPATPRAASPSLRPARPSVLITPVALFAVVLIASGELSPSAASAQPEDATAVSQTSPKAKQLEGVWDAQVTVSDPQTGATLRTFRGMTLFIAGGTLQATNNNPNSPVTTGPQFGTWGYLGHKRYRAHFQFFRFNPDGSFAGQQRVSRDITLDPGAQSFTSTNTFEILDPSGNVIQTGTNRETSVRVP